MINVKSLAVCVCVWPAWQTFMKVYPSQTHSTVAWLCSSLSHTQKIDKKQEIRLQCSRTKMPDRNQYFMQVRVLGFSAWPAMCCLNFWDSQLNQSVKHTHTERESWYTRAPLFRTVDVDSQMKCWLGIDTALYKHLDIDILVSYCRV